VTFTEAIVAGLDLVTEALYFKPRVRQCLNILQNCSFWWYLNVLQKAMRKKTEKDEIYEASISHI